MKVKTMIELSDCKTDQYDPKDFKMSVGDKEVGQFSLVKKLFSCGPEFFAKGYTDEKRGEIVLDRFCKDEPKQKDVRYATVVVRVSDLKAFLPEYQRLTGLLDKLDEASSKHGVLPWSLYSIQMITSSYLVYELTSKCVSEERFDLINKILSMDSVSMNECLLDDDPVSCIDKHNLNDEWRRGFYIFTITYAYTDEESVRPELRRTLDRMKNSASSSQEEGWRPTVFSQEGYIKEAQQIARLYQQHRYERIRELCGFPEWEDEYHEDIE